MFGISDRWAFVATGLAFLELPWPGTFDSALIVGGNWTARRLQAHRWGRWLWGFAGVAQIAFGARLATE